MHNIKWGVIAGAGAFIFSLLVGSLHHVTFFSLIIRAIIFAVVFFALGVGSYVLINNYLSDLLISGSISEDATDTLSGAGQPGSRINITLGEGGALPEMYQKAGNSEEVGNFTDLVSGAFNPAAASPDQPAVNGMDQTPQDEYNKGESAGLDSAFPVPMDSEESAGSAASTDTARSAPREEFQSAPAYNGPLFTASVSEGGDVGGLPDLNAMTGAFLSGDDESPAEQSAIPEMPAPVKSPGEKKPEGFEGDFNPKDLAEGIRTILAKEKQG